MSIDDQYKMTNKNWYPCFKESQIEHQFMQEFNADALKAGRIGMLIILVVWIGFAWFDMHLNSPARSSALFFRLFVITPVFLVILATLYSKFATTVYQRIVILGLSIIEGSIYYVVKFYDFEEICQSMGLKLPLDDADGKYLFLFVWFLVIFMGSMIVRLNIFYSVLNGMVIIFLIVLSIINYHPSTIIIIIAIPFLITALPAVWIGSLHVQQYARQNFRAAKLLAHSMEESESLLLNILPVQIANRLKKAPGTIADRFNHVSVLFADIVGFTRFSEQYNPEIIVDLLNQIFSRFDQISKEYGAEKIKTIGDAYMLAAGIPEVNPNHCDIVANCALDMIKAAEDFFEPDGNPIQIRIGIHTGPAIAGVIGTHKFSYDLWGDTVNTASRMESHGGAGKIQVTKEIAKALEKNFILEPRNEIEVKGKGKMQTYWLIDRL